LSSTGNSINVDVRVSRDDCGLLLSTPLNLAKAHWWPRRGVDEVNLTSDRNPQHLSFFGHTTAALHEKGQVL
jgi:hypothetical protein